MDKLTSNPGIPCSQQASTFDYVVEFWDYSAKLHTSIMSSSASRPLTRSSLQRLRFGVVGGQFLTFTAADAGVAKRFTHWHVDEMLVANAPLIFTD